MTRSLPDSVPQAGIAVIQICLTAALVYEAKHTGLTIDEPSHFAAGYMYWLGQDVLTPADQPPLTRAISGWVALLRHAPDPRQSKYWQSRDAYTIGAEILSDRTNGRRLLFYSRLPFLIFPIGLVFLLWYWGRQVFSERTALLLASCGALEPTILGHGALIKSADSNVDWGQNYPDLGAYFKKHRVAEARMFLFSFDNPWHDLKEGSLAPQPLPMQVTTPPFQPPPGLYVVSVNFLTGLLFPRGREDYLKTFRERTPIGRAGYSILIYKVD